METYINQIIIPKFLFAVEIGDFKAAFELQEVWKLDTKEIGKKVADGTIYLNSQKQWIAS